MSPFADSRDSLSVSGANGDPQGADLTEEERFDRALDRYFAGECSAAERAEFERTVLGDASGAGDALGAMVAALGGGDRPTRDAAASWRAFHERVVAPARRPVSVRPGRRVPAWVRTGVTAAATLVVGIIVGRASSSVGRSPAVVPMGPVAVASPAGGASALATPAAVPMPAPEAVPRLAPPATRVASAVPRRSRAEPPRPARGSAPATDATDRIVAQHLRHTDVFLTSFRADARSGRVSPEVITWARQLLVTTEMLRDSKAVHDPRMHSLLRDLELVLVQIAHYQPQRGALDVELVQDAMDDSGLLTRVRGAIPDHSTGAGS